MRGSEEATGMPMDGRAESRARPLPQAADYWVTGSTPAIVVRCIILPESGA
jgi:hypothetical protein